MKGKKVPAVLASEEAIIRKIYLIRGKKVMLDRDLAVLYKVQTKVLNQSVKRNIKRFPEEFIFQLTKEELENWRSQFVTSNSIKMGLRYLPMAFTEQGVAMLSSVLKSDRAVEANIQIMRVFVKLRQMVLDNEDLRKELEKLKLALELHADGDIRIKSTRYPYVVSKIKTLEWVLE